jgi:hypothetical protein
MSCDAGSVRCWSLPAAGYLRHIQCRCHGISEQSHASQKIIQGMRKISAVVIARLGIYFIAAPFWN